VQISGSIVGNQVDTGDATCSALERVVADMQTTRSEIARLQAQEARLLADAADIVSAREEQRRAAGRRTPHDLPLREVSAELGAAMRLSDRTAQARMSAAGTLVAGFAKTFRALRKGRIDLAHAWAITDCGTSISDPVMRAEYERILLEAAAFETPPRLRAIARVVAARIDPEMAAELQRRAVGARRIRLIDLEDGMARLLADLPAVLAHAIYDRLTQMAEVEHQTERAEAEAAAAESRERGVRAPAGGQRRGETDAAADAAGGALPDALDAAWLTSATNGPDAECSDSAIAGCLESSSAEPYAVRLSTGLETDDRTLDELRADIFADLVLTGAPTGHGDGDTLASIRAEVQITVPVLTAAGKSDQPALLAGYGPIDRETACELAAGATGWDRVMYDPHSGLPMAVDRYRPTAALRRFLRARDERCRFPGCPRRPTRADIDHTIDRAWGGPTRDDNLAHVCRRHHTVKHATAWRVRQVGGGVLEWRSLTGRRYVDKPQSVVQFVPSRVFARLLASGYDGEAPF